MNEAKDFLNEGILVETSLINELKNIKIAIPHLAKQAGITFLSRKELPNCAEKIKNKLELFKGMYEGEQKKNLEEAISYFSQFIQNKNTIFSEERTYEKSRVITSWNLPSRKISVEDFTKYFQA